MTSPTLFDPRPIARVADQVVGALQPGRLVAVEGPPGAGRHTLVEALRERITEAVVVHVPSAEDVDAPLHAVLQAASALGPDAVRDAADGSAKKLARRARDVARGLSARGRILIVHVPARFRPTAERLDDDEPNAGWLTSLVGALNMADSTLTIALVVPSGELAPALRRKFKPFVLPNCEASLNALSRGELWGAYADAAAALHVALGNIEAAALTPLQVRLMVGLVGLGAPPSTVAEHSRRAMPPGDLAPFARQLVGVLSREDHAEVRASVRRLLLMRRPLPVDAALTLAKPPAAHTALLRHCIGYGDESLRVPDLVRSFLLQFLARTADDARTHKSIADHHAALDGARSPAEAARGQRPRDRLEHWLEKVHHLAHSGPLGAADWEQQEVRNRELLIDRARALSIEHRDYDGAARIYQRCLELWPRDSYALHYRGYNLDRAGGEPTEVERCLRAAVRARKTNLFHNSRLVTFLIEQGRPLDAEVAWGQALANLSGRSPSDVAFHVALHVVQSWLDAGDVRRARRTFDALPLGLERVGVLERTEHRLLDAEEAVALGVSVYPPNVAMHERWTKPHVAQPSRRGAKLVRWAPGRVLSASEDTVVLALVTPDPEPAKRRVFSMELDPTQWSAIATWAEPADAAGYVELAEYQGGQTVIYSVSSEPPPSTRRPREEEPRPHPLRYLRRSIPGSPLG